MTNEELDRLQALCDGATAGPWGVTGAFNQLVDSAPDSDDPRTIIAEVWKRNAMREPTEQGKADLSFIAASRTALPALIAEVRKLTRETEFLRKAYHEKSALIRLLIDTQALAQTVAEGPFKDYYDRVAPLPNCNDCGRKGCEYRPRPGDQVRINCPLWRALQPTKEDKQ